MEVPDLTDDEFVALLIDNLPRGWFHPDDKATGGSVWITLHGASKNDRTNHGKVLVAQRRCRLTTAVGTEIDDIATDWFGDTFKRYSNESDSNYRTRIVHRLFSRVATKAGVVQIVEDALGETPIIQERQNQYTFTGGYAPARDVSTMVAFYPGGGYAGGGTVSGGLMAYSEPLSAPLAHPQGPTQDLGESGYNETGAYKLDIGPYQALITVQQPEPDDDHFLTFLQIMDLINRLKPLATVMWVRVIGPASTGGVPVS